MFEVKLVRVRFQKSSKQTETLEVYYFTNENDEQKAFEEAKSFCANYNRTMPFHKDGYTIATKPSKCDSYLLDTILTEAISKLREQPKSQPPRKHEHALHKLGDYA